MAGVVEPYIQPLHHPVPLFSPQQHVPSPFGQPVLGDHVVDQEHLGPPSSPAARPAGGVFDVAGIVDWSGKILPHPTGVASLYDKFFSLHIVQLLCIP